MSSVVQHCLDLVKQSQDSGEDGLQDLDGVYHNGLGRNSVGFNDSQVVAVDTMESSVTSVSKQMVRST